MRYLKTYEEMSEESLEDLETKISNYFDEGKKDNLYALLSILKEEDPESYEEWKKKYDEL